MRETLVLNQCEDHGFREALLKEPYVQYLHRRLDQLSEKVETLTIELLETKDQLNKLKGMPSRPKLVASKLDSALPGEEGSVKKKGWSVKGKRKKKGLLKIHHTENIDYMDPLPGWRRHGYERRIIQDIIVQGYNTEYILQRWRCPNGEIKVAPLPDHSKGTHFGPGLKSYILHQYYECGVTQPLLLSSLHDYGVDISSGQINSILNDGNAPFHDEKEALLSVGKELSEELRTDDTGARHKFKNGFSTCINSDLFTYFKTTGTKSRINFLQILRGNDTRYCINTATLDYLKQVGSSNMKYYETLRQSYEDGACIFYDESILNVYLQNHGIKADYVVKQIKEGMLIGTLIEQGFNPQTIIHSDGAGQFNVFEHSLCWKHAERPLLNVKTYNKEHERLLGDKKLSYWSLYRSLCEYKKSPCPILAQQLDQAFDTMCTPVNNYASLNVVLQDIQKKKSQLMLVLYRPKTSLHNNDSERDIRELAKRRKISSGTRSENGKMSRDTFLSLKKTCRKLGVSFWEYLNDRFSLNNHIDQLSIIMMRQSCSSA